MGKKKNLYYLIFLVLISSCGLFSTRDPESPDTGKSKFIPPTTASIVISNFINAVKEKNTANYSSCFDSSETPESKYVFIPSADALSQYRAIFENWDFSDEIRTFRAIISNVSANETPVFELTNLNPINIQPFTESYNADYYLKIQHNKQGFNTVFAGTLQLIILRETNGYWYIQKWVDTKPANDTVGATWSILKAQFAN